MEIIELTNDDMVSENFALWAHFRNEHNLILTETELQEIIALVKATTKDGPTIITPTPEPVQMKPRPAGTYPGNYKEETEFLHERMEGIE